eukprot:CAMPEP_0113302308 /NCGR_PEP_ID=MMETSP0010_2-20120614/3170_1 /TAXON_ID=216773 ORGANISM="Corethron hystrix, Strain 308" /NCGR_SAMPLE_ID=MMETSP0010_2 /ASSEMBLY_ACC=CAM_ASM_000155 /LENGTH=384 /DNA_ID=CAMNT_0000156067 /DNA_START=8 /DNA_END=1162 /DNA_ORIENTATION=- /assembly_acc=CAM_ASM_000155
MPVFHRTVGRFAAVTSKYVERINKEVGPGGRSSVSGRKVAVFGPTGFLGRYVAGELGQNGTKCYFANRGCELETRHLKVQFDLGMCKFVFYSPRERDSMAEVIADSDVVINLIGKYYETKTLVSNPNGYFPPILRKTNYSFTEAHVDIPRTIAELCTEMQVDNLIHLSSLAAKDGATSEWARSKFEGEMAVREAYPWATILRPAQLFGPEDRLLNWFAGVAGKVPFIPVIDDGQALLQPVYMSDVAECIRKIVDEPDKFEGKTIDCFGGQDFTYKEIAEFVMDITKQGKSVVGVPKDIMKLIATFTQVLPAPVLTRDQVELWSGDYAAQPEDFYKSQVGNDKILTMSDLGVEATPIEKIAFSYLHRYREGGHFVMNKGYHSEIQ